MAKAQYSKADLDQCQRLARLQFAVHEIALALGRPADALAAELQNSRSAIYQAYHRGRIEAESELRSAIFDEAVTGSTPAMKQFIEVIKLSREQATRAHLDESRARRERAEAQAKELDVQQQQGQLLTRESVTAFFSQVATVTKQRLLNVPPKIAPEIAGKRSAREIQAILKTAIIEALEEIAKLQHDLR